MKKPPEIIITDEQWVKIKELWNSRPKNPPSLPELGELIFGRQDLDSRTAEGRAIRKKLAEAGLKTSLVRDSLVLELTDEQKEFIRNNPGNVTEITKTIFNNPSLCNLSRETRVVANYYKTVHPEDDESEAAEIPDKDYSPPVTIGGIIKRINKYKITNPIDPDKLTGKQKKDFDALLNFLHTFRFRILMDSYEKKRDRELLESSFIRYTYDKNDLTEEDVEQYINLAIESVISCNIRERIQRLTYLLSQTTDDEENRKISMSLVEAISTAETEYNQCVKRQREMADSLRIKRSERDDERKKGAASVLNLIELWKSEEERQKLIREAINREGQLDEEITRLSDLDRAKALIMGLDRNLILHG